MTYRDFVYLDIDRIQSIIAQTQKGILEQILEGKTNEIQGKAGIAAGILASFLPIQLETALNRKTDIYQSKVLHDYAYTIALEALQKSGMCFDVNDDNREQLPKTNAIFLLVRGSASILDYGLLKHMASSEFIFNSIAVPQIATQLTAQSRENKDNRQKGRQVPSNQTTEATNPGMMEQMSRLVEAIMGDAIQVRFEFLNNIIFAGILEREYLRESTRSFIFKYGGSPQLGWIMLAQMGQVTGPTNKYQKLQALAEQQQLLARQKTMNAASDGINYVIQALNVFQESMASVSYPDIAVTPIAIYRELNSSI